MLSEEKERIEILFGVVLVSGGTGLEGFREILLRGSGVVGVRVSARGFGEGVDALGFGAFFGCSVVSGFR